MQCIRTRILATLQFVFVCFLFFPSRSQIPSVTFARDGRQRIRRVRLPPRIRERKYTQTHTHTCKYMHTTAQTRSNTSSTHTHIRFIVWPPLQTNTHTHAHTIKRTHIIQHPDTLAARTHTHTHTSIASHRIASRNIPTWKTWLRVFAFRPTIISKCEQPSPPSDRRPATAHHPQQ